MGYEDFAKLHKDASGHFDVILSPTRPAGYGGDWWQLDPKASFLLLLQGSAEWTTERDPTISIERTDISVERPRPSAIDLEQRLRDVPRRAFNIASFLVDHVEGLRKDGYINKLRVFDVSNGSALVGQFYYEGAYELTSDEALIIERSEEHTSAHQSLMRQQYAVFCLTKK